MGSSPVRPATALVALVAAVAVSVWSAPDVGGTTTGTSSDTSVSSSTLSTSTLSSATRVLSASAEDVVVSVSTTTWSVSFSPTTRASVEDAPDFASGVELSLWTHTPTLPRLISGTACVDHRGDQICAYGRLAYTVAAVSDTATHSHSATPTVPEWVRDFMTHWIEGDRTDAEFIEVVERMTGVRGIIEPDRPVHDELRDLRRDVVDVRVAVQQLHRVMCEAGYC